MIVQSLNGAWEFRRADGEEWLRGTVPGGVHTDLMALGMLPDPFEVDNELRVQWVAEHDWEYRLEFDVRPDLAAAERAYLCCDGLDTLATVSLNDNLVGTSENMFRSLRWEVTQWLREGRNELVIEFGSPLAYVRPRQVALPLPSPAPCIQGGPYLRKVPSHFGWDWGPQLPPIGIWNDIRLEGCSTGRLKDVRVHQRHEAGRVTILADVRVDRWADREVQAVLTVTDPDGRCSEAREEIGAADGSAALSMEVVDPLLWWPNGYGEQPLYEVEVTLLQGDRELDQRPFRVGLRTVELRQEPDEYGKSFTFVVNGVPIFAKGANWIPADSFPTRITGNQLAHLIGSAADAHMNMLRVWGGGFYEEESFYDLCDRLGILVWQDFVFSCAIYPGDEEFFASVRKEAIENVRRLRHRASLALWCGNNEMEWGWVEWGWNGPDRLDLKQAYDRLFHRLLPGVCAAEDPGRPYWPSSPSSGVPFEAPNSVLAGDTHNWEVWHRNLPFSGYRDHPSRFVSEFGFQSLPALETVRTYAPEPDQNMTSYVMEHHQRSGSGNGKMITYLTDHFLLPKDFESLVYLTQLLQAEAMRVGVEHWRRNRACTSGALYWQLNDCWPVASWSSIDYCGRWKALHYAARRFFAPVLLSADDDGEQIGLSITNDTTQPWEGCVSWTVETVDGNVLDRGDEGVIVPPLCAREVCALDLSGIVNDSNRREVVLVYSLARLGRRISQGVVTFAPSKHLLLPDPGLSWRVVETDLGYEIDVAAERLARFVWLELQGLDVIFSDNFFDLPAGREARVLLPHPDGLSLDRVTGALRVRSLVDSF
jgi:beta-mannosidase